jgi:hypothetical protein
VRRAIQDGGRGRRVRIVTGVVLSLIAAAAASAGEWEDLRESYDRALRTHAKRIADIGATERGMSADVVKHANKITRDRITSLKASPKAGGKAQGLADAAGRASGDAVELAELARAQAMLVDLATREWGPGGSERSALRDSMVGLQKSLERANAGLASAADIALATATSVPESGAGEQVAQIEAQVKDAGDRIRTRWLNQQAALDRERLERERAAAERGRSLR